jgi:FMN phosphatase YigB (HAD superfamily)
MTTVYSFDVYDTCLVRTFARPEDLFIELARSLLPPTATPEAVAHMARQPEQAAPAPRAAAAREDITLADIYRHFAPALAEWGLDDSRAMTTEINLEIACVRPIRAMQQRLDHLRQQGRRIIFISDMYLPAPIIRLMLLNHGLARPADPVYVSGDIGLTKASGHLFEYVLAQEQLHPAQLHHHGDNPRSDVLAAHRLGIRATYFSHSQLNRYEQRAFSPGRVSPDIAGATAAASRVARLCGTAYSPATQPVLDCAASVVAPLLVSFVSWVLQDAHNRGLHRLYFVSRDGQILWKIAQILARYIPAPECRYLYGSRQAWQLPATLNPGSDDLDWLWLHQKTVATVLVKLEIDPAEIAPVLAQYNFTATRLDDPLDAAAELAFRQVLQQPQVAALIQEKAAAARAMTLAYFEQEQFLAPGPWALVDVGWALRGQRSVKRILSTVAPPLEVRGYYLTVSEARSPSPRPAPTTPLSRPLTLPVRWRSTSWGWITPWFLQTCFSWPITALWPVTGPPTARSSRCSRIRRLRRWSPPSTTLSSTMPMNLPKQRF